MQGGDRRVIVAWLGLLAAIAPWSLARAQSVRTDGPSAALEPAIATTAADAGDAPDADLDPASRVTPPATPTHVHAAISLIALNRISAPNDPFPTFDATVMLSARWSDPRVAFDAEDEGDDRRVYLGDEALEALEDVWTPDLAIENEDGERNVDARTLVIRDEGTVVYEETFDGRFRTQFDLRAFPFDSQELSLVLESTAWNSRVLVLHVMDDRVRSDVDSVGQDWTIEGVGAAIGEASEVRSGRPFSTLTTTVRVRRHPGFYLSKVMLPLLLIVAFTWTTFWMTGEPAGTRMQRGFIALLSIVAFTQVIAQHLPRISYVTFLDWIMYLAFASTGATLLQIVATHHATMRKDDAAAARLDRIARVAFPASFLVLVALVYAVHAR